MTNDQLTRRAFLRRSTVGLLASTLPPWPVGAGEQNVASAGNQWPGRIAICRDRLMWDGGQVDAERVKSVLAACLRELADQESLDDALQAILPGCTPESTIAIKVNCIAQCATRWELAWALCGCFTEMFGGAYDVAQVAIFDQNYIAGAGYVGSRFTFDGSLVQLTDDPPFGTGVYPVPGHELTSLVADADYLVDMPVLKDHNDNQLTLSFKNHYGSVNPQGGMCGDYETMLALNAAPEIRDKTALVLLDGILGVWQGGPGQPAQYWSTYGNGLPCTLFVSTDPVTVEYWGRDTINRERSYHGLQPYEASYIEQASGAPYQLGVSDPSQMDVRSLHLGADDPPDVSPAAVTMPAYPNPTSGPATLRFRLGREADVVVGVYDTMGRKVADVGGGRFPAGSHAINWTGRDASGDRVAPGLYTWVLNAGTWQTTGSIIVVK